MIVSCVLRQSPVFGPTHVAWLAEQCSRFLPEWDFLPFSDVPVAGQHVRLTSDLPSWWSKMEIMRADLPGPVLILDLDLVILRPWTTTAEQLSHSYVMRHPTRDGCLYPEQFNCAIMLTTPDFRAKASAHFKPEHMDECVGDDQIYYKRYFDKELRRFQDEWPDEFVSYKLHVKQHGLRPDNTFINFHGLPRPWDLSEPWIPCLHPAEPSQADA